MLLIILAKIIRETENRIKDEFKRCCGDFCKTIAIHSSVGREVCAFNSAAMK